MLRRCFIFMLLLSLTGCSEPTQTLSGTVKLDGKPTAGIILTFLTSNNRTVNADTDKDGKYKVEIVGSGEVKVTAQIPPPAPKPRPDPPKATKGAPGLSAAKDDDAGKMARMPDPSETPPAVPLDPKYNKPETSGLGFTLTGGEQIKDFDLSTTGKGK